MRPLHPLLFAAAALAAPLFAQNDSYLFKTGGGSLKTDLEQCTLLTLNVCMMDGDFPKRFGGMIHADERIGKLGEFLRSESPDFFLGQELSLRSGLLLYSEIKGEFPYFWVGMGAEPGIKQSGLFAASKYPLVSEPVFVPFPEEITPPLSRFPDGKRPIDRGFFLLETERFWVVSTHMESGTREESEAIRRSQLAYLTQTADALAGEKPYLLVGDLNISRTNEPFDEYSQSGIAAWYYDPFTESHPEFCDQTYTCTNRFTIDANGAPEPSNYEGLCEIDDYVLIRKKPGSEISANAVELLNTHDAQSPREEALSDHRAYKATFRIE